jgi:integrase
VARNYGSGSIKEVRDGVWRLRVRAGVDNLTGKPRIVTETFHGKNKAAQQRLAELVAKHTGQRTSSSVTLGWLIKDWLATAQIVDATKQRYEHALKHLPDHWRARRADQVTRRDLEQLYAELSKRKVGASTIRKLHNCLSGAFSAAVRWDLVPANPCRGARAPRERTRPDVVPGPEVLRAVLQAAKDDDEQTLVWLTLAIVTGARRAEVLALRWRDVDLDKHQVSINASIDASRSRAATKTRQTRIVPIDESTVALLRSWRVAQMERALAVQARITPACYVLSHDLTSRTPWTPHAITTKFARLRSTVGVECRLHDLRHAYATALLNAGVPAQEVSSLMGHSKTSTTLDIYAHVVDRRGPSAAEIIRKVVG